MVDFLELDKEVEAVLLLLLEPQLKLSNGQMDVLLAMNVAQSLATVILSLLGLPSPLEIAME